MKADYRRAEKFFGNPAARCALGLEIPHASWLATKCSTFSKPSIARCRVAETEERVTPDVLTARFLLLPLPQAGLHTRGAPKYDRSVREHVALGRDYFAYFKHERPRKGPCMRRGPEREVQ